MDLPQKNAESAEKMERRAKTLSGFIFSLRSLRSFAAIKFVFNA